MAEITVSCPTSNVNENNPIHIAFLNSGIPAVSSRDVALHFQKKHQHILRDIDRIRSQVPKIFFETNFGQSSFKIATGNGTVRNFPVYTLTRDAFSLLVMGFTGKAAIQWKLRYIEAFNTLEAAVLENRAELARESGYLQGLDEGRAAALPELKAAEARARLDTARLFWVLGPTQKRRLRRAAHYRDMGLSQREIGKLMEISRRSVQELLMAADALGGLPERAAQPVQGNLLALNAAREVEA